MKRGPKPKDRGECAHCGKPLTKRWQDKYCSRDCMWEYQRNARAEAKVKRWTRVCEQCGKEFVMHAASGKANRGEVKEGRFCSRKCRGKWVSSLSGIRVGKYKVGETRPIFIKTCVVCGALFTARWDRRLPLCSQECRNTDSKNKYYENREVILKQMREEYEPKPKTERLCIQCGNPFFGRNRDVHCSDICRQKTKRGMEAKRRAKKAGVYYEPVDPLKVFKRDGWRCQLCGKKLKPKHRGTIRDDAPELDHIIPWAQGGEHSYRNTQCACRKCNQEKGARELGQLRLFG